MWKRFINAFWLTWIDFDRSERRPEQREDRSRRAGRMAYYVYILKCSDGSYYTGSTANIDKRIYEHQQGLEPSAYTFRRRPVELIWSEELETYNEALLHEHQIKGWSRIKKEALIRGDFQSIHEIVGNERKEREQRKRNL